MAKKRDPIFQALIARPPKTRGQVLSAASGELIKATKHLNAARQLLALHGDLQAMAVVREIETALEQAALKMDLLSRTPDETKPLGGK